MTDFNDIILSCFSDEEVYLASLAVETDCLNAHADKFVDSALSAGFLPEALVNALRNAADDVEHAYGSDEE